MGYHTEFQGSMKVDPPLNDEEIRFLNKFSETRRMKCEQGPYFVDRSGLFGQGEEGVIEYNNPPDGQPSLWCGWVSSDDGSEIEWNGTEKFYNADEWMEYIVFHFIGPSPIAKPQLPFLQGHTITGTINAFGEEGGDIWRIVADEDGIRREDGGIVYR